MFESSWTVRNPGVKYKRNPLYETKDIKIMKIENVPNGTRLDGYSELVDPNFVGKLAIFYDEDGIGRSGGHPYWCYVYDCDHGKLLYKGIAIHKGVDSEYQDQNYNEVLYSALGSLVFDPDSIRCPKVDLVKNLEWPEDKPAMLSYNVVNKGRDSASDLEEMRMMKTIAYNTKERQEFNKEDRVPLSTILDSTKVEVMKTFEEKKVSLQEKIDEQIINLKLANPNEANNEQISLLTAIRNHTNSINGDTTIDTFLSEVSEELGRTVSAEELQDIKIGNIGFEETLNGLKTTFFEREEQYKKLEKSIVQVMVVDLMTNNIDRHLQNWALIRNIKTDEYTLGIFDHATAFYNMSFSNDHIAITQDWLKRYWAPSSVLLKEPEKLKSRTCNGIEVFDYLIKNYREYTVEMLQRMHDKLPEYKKMIEYESIPNAEYDKLPEEEKKKYYRSDLDKIVNPEKVIKGIKSKFKRIYKDYGVYFDENEREEYDYDY